MGDLWGMDYRKGSHTTFAIEYHFAFVTKYRRRVLRGDVAERLRELGRQSSVGAAARLWRSAF